TDLVHGLKAADVDETGKRSRRLWGRNALVVAQIAMSLMLLAASFLMYRGFDKSLRLGIGISEDAASHLLLVRFDPRLVQYDAAQTQRFYRLLAQRARESPGGRSPTLTPNPPLGLDAFGRLAFVPEGLTMPRERESVTATLDVV